MAPAIFLHAGAGFHSVQNELQHLTACKEYVVPFYFKAESKNPFSACEAAMAMLRAGGSAMDAVEVAIRALEDREITNAGYGSNLTMAGVVECDAVMVDHQGFSGGVGAVARLFPNILFPHTLLIPAQKLRTR
jgi:taspase, threonine aspartase, 1